MGKYKSSFLKYFLLPIADKVMKTTLAYSYREITKMRRYSSEEIKQWQNLKLQKLIQHAYHNSNYYRELFDKNGLGPNDIKSQNDLELIPVLTKDAARNRFNDIIPSNISTIAHKKSATGGSTGDPLAYWLDHNSWSFSNANTIINWERIGYNYGDKYIALGSTSLFVDKKPSNKHLLYYKMKNKIGLNGINMSEAVCQEYVALIKRNNIRFIYGYASSIYLLAKYLIKTKTELNIEVCFTTAERLTDLYKDTIMKAFNCAILDCYGAHDGGITAFAHEEDCFEVSYNCLVRQNNPDHNGIGPALLTDLTNYAMPLINYQLGDEVQINKNSGVYSYNGQILNKVLGRTSDVIYLENGNILTGPGFTILFKDLPVEHYCIEKDGYNTITISITKLPEYNSTHEKIVISTLQKHMGPGSKLNINYTDNIELADSGKRCYFKVKK